MKRIAAWLFKFVVTVALIVAAGTLIPRPLFSQAAAGTATQTIYVAVNPIHSDMVIPLDDSARKSFAFLGQAGLPIDNPDAKWLFVGWGGRAFYIETPTWAQMKPLPVLKALTLDQSVMHVELAGDVKPDSPSLVPITLSPQHYNALIVEMVASFAVDESGNPDLIEGAAFGEYDKFYEANGGFNALVGCNTWTARMLRTGGIRTGLWNPLPQLLRVSLDLYN